MSTAKRSRRRQADGRSVSPQPDAKRFKVAKSPHVPGRSGLDFLVDDEARAGKKLQARLTNGVRNSKFSRVDDSRTIVAPDSVRDDGTDQVNKAPEIISVSSDNESSSMDDDEDPVGGQNTYGAGTKGLLNGHITANGHATEQDDEDDQQHLSHADERKSRSVSGADAQDDDAALDEPTFSDLLKARHPEPIDVSGSGPSYALVSAPDSRGLAPPSLTSLGTVLTQALKTNDRDLLESCFRLTDLPSIRSTIQRLPSQHVATLLQRIAERIHKRPGRTGSLMAWIQWSLVAHGAYLASQPDVMRKVKSLAHVVRERANGLQPLLHLKGKLDLLGAQLELRRSQQGLGMQTDDEDDEDAALYLEKDDGDAWSASEESEGGSADQPRQRTSHKEASNASSIAGLPNGLSNGLDSYSSNEDDGGSEEEEDDDIDDDDDDGDMLEIEAEEVSDDEDDEAKDSDVEAESELEESDDDESDGSDGSVIRVQTPSTLARKR